jgi:hypothetical protein
MPATEGIHFPHRAQLPSHALFLRCEFVGSVPKFALKWVPNLPPVPGTPHNPTRISVFDELSTLNQRLRESAALLTRRTHLRQLRTCGTTAAEGGNSSAKGASL